MLPFKKKKSYTYSEVYRNLLRGIHHLISGYICCCAGIILDYVAGGQEKSRCIDLLHLTPTWVLPFLYQRLLYSFSNLFKVCFNAVQMGLLFPGFRPYLNIQQKRIEFPKFSTSRMFWTRLNLTRWVDAICIYPYICTHCLVL